MADNEKQGAEPPDKRLLREGVGSDFALTTSIINETPSPLNPYHSSLRTLRGETAQSLAELDFLDTLYFTFRGSKPEAQQSELLSHFAADLLMISPRENAVRATVGVAVSRTQVEHMLPIAAMVLGTQGATGAASVASAMRGLRRALRRSPEDLVKELQSEGRLLDGYGATFNGADPWANETLSRLVTLPGAGSCLGRANGLNIEYHKEGQGILISGVAAAVFCDLGFHPRQGVVLMQYLQLPAVLAQSLDAYGRIEQDTFPSDENYHVEVNKGDY